VHTSHSLIPPPTAGYNTEHSIVGSEFLNTGDSAIAAAGNAKFADATASDFPFGNSIEGNHFHGLGIYGKQASAYFQTLSCRNSIIGNVMYDGPRAGGCFCFLAMHALANHSVFILLCYSHCILLLIALHSLANRIAFSC
jgi:hypothetical protein